MIEHVVDVGTAHPALGGDGDTDGGSKGEADGGGCDGAIDGGGEGEVDGGGDRQLGLVGHGAFAQLWKPKEVARQRPKLTPSC